MLPLWVVGLSLALQSIGGVSAFAAGIPVGTGAESAAVVINFSDGAAVEFLVSYPGPTTTGEQLLRIIDAARSDFTLTSSGTGGGFPGGFFIQRIEYAGHGDGPDFIPPDGWWHYWTANSLSAPWEEGLSGAGERVIDNGYRDGWVFGNAAAPVPEPAGLAVLGIGVTALLRRRRRCQRIAGLAAGAAIASAMLPVTAHAAYAYDPNDFAVEVVSATGPFGGAPYDSAAAVLGRPTLKFNSAFTSATDIRRAKLIEASFNVGPSGEKLMTTLPAGSQITVRMGRPVVNDPQNPFGIDFIVFGNAFYSGGSPSDATNLNTTILGPAFAEEVKVSVSPNGTDWFRYDSGPFGDGVFPTNSYHWNTDAAAWTDVESDPTLPVNPALASQIAGKTASFVLDNIYAGSAGGTGFDLAASGFSSIQYIRVEGLEDFDGGEIDAFADVRAVPEPGAALVAGILAISLLRRRRPGRNVLASFR